MPLLLKTDEIASMLDMKKGIEITEQVLQELSRGQARVHAPYHLGVPNGAIRVVSASLLETGTVGLRYGPALNLTPPSGFRNHLCSLYRVDGELLAIMGYPFSQLRTGATVGAAAKHLTPEGGKTVAMIGTGMNALSLIEGVQAVREITRVEVFSRDAERRQKFADEAARATGLNVVAADSMHGANWRAVGRAVPESKPYRRQLPAAGAGLLHAAEALSSGRSDQLWKAVLG
jgi:ornithine cyclodeaminase